MKLRLFSVFVISIAAGFATGCAHTGDSLENAASLDGFWCDLTGTPATYYQRPLPANLMPAYPRECFAGDRQVPTANACLVDDAVCYQLDSGPWCTAGRAPQCPAGAAPITMDAPCPEGGKCWMYSEGLRCHTAGA
ncbi:hypothetical protein [Microbulbifer sp. Q7]|uniref:hypothetical protein n=1 Tax=Microbulbifer sp. Q7 TaxID=1785091 RepID=UPI00082FA39D|nr:hypothetical protein [Microbulbifer sp. Q7]